MMIISTALMAQNKVVIKERVEIAPKTNLALPSLAVMGSGYTVNIEANWDKPILGRLFVDGYYGVEPFYGVGSISASVKLHPYSTQCGYPHSFDLQLRVAELMPEDIVRATVVITLGGNEIFNVSDASNGSFGGSDIFCQFPHQFEVVPPVDHFDVTITPDTVYSYEYASLKAVAIDIFGQEAPIDQVCLINISAEPSAYFLGPSSVTYFEISGGDLYVGASDEFIQPVQDIIITVSGLGISGTCKLVVKKPSCLVMSVSGKKIQPGEKVGITLMEMDSYGNLTSYPPDQVFSLWMNTDEQYGRLHCISTGGEGSYVYGQQPFEFIAADNIDVDSTVVEISASFGGGGVGSIGVVTKDTLHSGPIMAKRETQPKIIGAAPNEMKRNNVELSIDRLQTQLTKVSARKGNEKQQQKLALGIEQLKARLAYETAKTPAEKKTALASIKQIAKNSSVQEECKSTAEVTITNECPDVIFPPCIDQTSYNEIKIIPLNDFCGDGGQIKEVPPDPQPGEAEGFFIYPQICYNESGKCYGLMIPAISAHLLRCVGDKCCIETIEVNSADDVKDKETALLVIAYLINLEKNIKNVIGNYEKYGASLDYFQKRIDQTKVHSTTGVYLHEENHLTWFFTLFEKTLNKIKAKLPQCTSLPCYNRQQIEDYFAPKINELQNSFKKEFKDNKKDGLKDSEIKSHNIQGKFIEKLINDIRNKFGLNPPKK
jgi:hypothetical protein